MSANNEISERILREFARAERAHLAEDGEHTNEALYRSVCLVGQMTMAEIGIETGAIGGSPGTIGAAILDNRDRITLEEMRIALTLSRLDRADADKFRSDTVELMTRWGRLEGGRHLTKNQRDQMERTAKRLGFEMFRKIRDEDILPNSITIREPCNQVSLHGRFGYWMEPDDDEYGFVVIRGKKLEGDMFRIGILKTEWHRYEKQCAQLEDGEPIRVAGFLAQSPNAISDYKLDNGRQYARYVMIDRVGTTTNPRGPMRIKVRGQILEDPWPQLDKAPVPGQAPNKVTWEMRIRVPRVGNENVRDDMMVHISPGANVSQDLISEIGYGDEIEVTGAPLCKVFGFGMKEHYGWSRESVYDVIVHARRIRHLGQETRG